MRAAPSARPPGRPFTRADTERAPRRIINRGRWANATVFVHVHDGVDWVVKDFGVCPLPYRATVGRFMVQRELAALERLHGISGIPTDAFRIDSYALAYRFVPGSEIAIVGPDGATPDYFRELEATVLAMHARGITHLDLRSGGNILVTETGHPLVIDFQSHIKGSRLPGFLWRMLVNVDLGGVYKHWWDRHPDSLGIERRAIRDRAKAWRRFWFLKPYFWAKRTPDDNRAPGD